VGAKTFTEVCGVKPQPTFKIIKSDDDQRLVFGWASVAVRPDGDQIIDYQGDAIDIGDLEQAAYDFVGKAGVAGEMHERVGVGTLVESMFFSKEKAAALGLPDGIVPDGGWWVGFHIDDDEVWQKIKDGEYSMFSIGGHGDRTPLETEGQ
jgi:hypothetical protein